MAEEQSKGIQQIEGCEEMCIRDREKKYRVRFFADGTKEQLGKLIAFMNENNIKYGKIAKESK